MNRRSTITQTHTTTAADDVRSCQRTVAYVVAHVGRRSVVGRRRSTRRTRSTKNQPPRSATPAGILIPRRYQVYCLLYAAAVLVACLLSCFFFSSSSSCFSFHQSIKQQQQQQRHAAAASSSSREHSNTATQQRTQHFGNSTGTVPYSVVQQVVPVSIFYPSFLPLFSSLCFFWLCHFWTFRLIYRPLLLHSTSSYATTYATLDDDRKEKEEDRRRRQDDGCVKEWISFFFATTFLTIITFTI